MADSGYVSPTPAASVQVESCAVPSVEKTVNFRHPDYVAHQERWCLVDDMCDSTNLENHYIPLNPGDKSKENKLLNEVIFDRAIFYSIAGYTARGLIGKAFSKEPKIEIPNVISYVDTNIDGAGVSLVQQAQDSAKEVIRKGRAGLLIDMAASPDGREFSKEDLQSNFATISLYKAEQIINWRVMQVGSQIVTSQVVLAYTKNVDGDDGFSFTSAEVRMVLAMNLASVEGESGSSWVYSMTEWTRNLKDIKKWDKGTPIFPTDAAGKHLTRIPFVFLGSESNTTAIDEAPMYDIAVVNAGHFNNSAEYEDAVFTSGQPQPWMSGITQEIIDLYSANNMYIGSRRLIGVPAGESFGIEQAGANTLAKEAMDDKVVMAVSLGAMIIQPRTVNKTATQSSGELMTQHSVLSLIVSNISEGYYDALGWLIKFMSTANPKYAFELNKDFVDVDIDANEIREMIAGFLGEALSPADFHQWLKKNRLTDPDKSLDEWMAERQPQDDLGLDDDEYQAPAELMPT
jgi:hypothetical protein